MNGNTKGDEEGEVTYIGGRGETVIDYMIGDNQAREKVKSMEVGDRIDSDLLPIIIEIESKRWERKEERKVKKVARGDWSREGKERFRRGIRWEEESDKEINEEVEDRLNEIRRMVEEEESNTGRERKKRKGWWDEEAKGKKKES